MKNCIFLFFLFFSCAEKPTAILYFNDAHEITSVPTKVGNKGGVAHLQTLVNNLRKEKDVFLIFGGDLAGGTLFGKVYKGLPMVQAFNQIPVDIANFGQHEFDFGLDNAKYLVEKSDFQWITSNLTNEKTNPLFGLPTFFVKEINTIKVGFIGLTDRLTTTTTKNVVQKEMIESAKKAVMELKYSNVEYIIAITQTPIAENEDILKNIPEINMILTEETSETITKILCYETKYIIAPIGNMGSVVEIKLHRKKDKIIEEVVTHYLGDDLEEDEKMKKFATNFQDSLQKTLSEVIGVAAVDVERVKHRTQESAMGNLIADAYRDYFNADIGLINAGGIRNGLSKGVISLKDIYAVLPFNNKIGVVEITGKELLNIISKGLSRYRLLGGEFLQVSGINYKIKVTKDGNANLASVSLSKLPLRMDKKYLVAMPDYVMNGGGDLPEIPKEKRRTDKEEFVLDSDILSSYLKKKGVISPKLEGRIVIEQ